MLIWATWIDICSKLIETLTDKATDCRYNVTLTISYILSTIIVRVLLKCMILKVLIRISMIFLNVIWVDIVDKTESAKAVSELKDLFVFWSIFIKFSNLSMLSLLFFRVQNIQFLQSIVNVDHDNHNLVNKLKYHDVWIRKIKIVLANSLDSIKIRQFL